MKCSTSQSVIGIVVLSVLFCGTWTTNVRAEVISISGYVIDENGDGIDQAKIMVFAAKSEWNPVAAKSDKNGFYSIRVDKCAEVIIVYSKFQRLKIKRLVGHRDHFISRVFETDGSMAKATFECLQAVEEIAFTSLENPEMQGHLHEFEMLPSSRILAAMVEEVSDDGRKQFIVDKFTWMNEQELIKVLDR